MKNKIIYFVIFIILIITSCSTFIQLPRFVTIDQINQLKVGMNKEKVDSILVISPYDFKSIDKDGNTTVIYKYRVFERLVDKDNIEPDNGKDVWGKFDVIFITFSKDEKIIYVNTCNDCDNYKTIIK